MANNNFTCGKRPIRTGGPTAVPPAFSAAPAVSGPSAVGSTLTLTYTATGTPTPTAAVQWFSNAVAISGATGLTFNTTGQPVGAVITAQVSLTNGVGVPVAASSTPVMLSAVPVAPTFTSGPTVSGSPVVGSVLTATYTASGTPVPTATYQWQSNGVPIPGATGSTYTSTTVGEVLSCAVSLTNGVGGFVSSLSNAVSVTASAAPIPQDAIFGQFSLAGEDDWRPQLADGRVEDIASITGLQSGSLGAHTPVLSNGRLVFSGASAGPTGAVIRVVGVSGRIYDVTIQYEANRRGIGKWADINRDRTVAGNVGKKIVVRQNAQIPAMSRLVAATAFMNCSSSAVCATGLNAPTFIEGEGPRNFADEHHLHSWRGFPVSELTIQKLRWADQKTTSSIIFESTATIRMSNISVKQNTFDIFYDVDGTTADWSAGFGSTGFAKSRYVYVTNSDNLSNIEVTDNDMRHGYLPIEIRHSGYCDVSGNRMVDPYFDFRKHSSSPTAISTDNVTFVGANYYSASQPYSVNETVLTAPHFDVNQVVSGGPGTLTTYLEFNVAYFPSALSVQTLFNSDRVSPQTGGFNWIIRGDVYIVKTTHAATNTWPDNVHIDRMMILPNHLTALPQSSSINHFKFGSTIATETASLGSHVLTNSTSNGYTVSPPIAGSFSISTPGYVDTGAWTATNFGNTLTRWGDWSTMPAETSYTDALSYAGAIVGSALSGATPVGQFTPGSTLQSDYMIPLGSVFAPISPLLGLTVTDNSTGAFTVDPNIPHTATVFWNITAAAVTDPTEIKRGVLGKNGVSAWGIKNRVGATGLLAGPGAAAALATGNYSLNIARFDGRKKTIVQNIAFTAP